MVASTVDTISTVDTEWRVEHRAAMNFGVASIPLPNDGQQMKTKLQLQYGQECNSLFCLQLDC